MATVISMSSREARYRGLRMTADEYLVLEDDGYRYELVDGVVCMSPSPSRFHQKVVAEIARQVGNFLVANPVGEVIVEVDVCLGDDLVYRPDIVFLSASKAACCGERITMVPDVVVEVLSPDSRRYDLETKKADYERCAVAEYWLIDPEKRQFVFLRLDSGRYVEVSGADQFFASQVIPGFILDLQAVRRLFA